MRSVKRPRRTVQRYKPLLFPGIALLAVFVFWAAVVPEERGETVEFQKEGLLLEITSVHHVGGFMANFDPERHSEEPYDTYHIYPGAKVTVLEALPMEGGKVRWVLRAAGGERREPLELTGGMDPLEFTEEETFSIYDLERGLTVLDFYVTEDDQEYWK